MFEKVLGLALITVFLELVAVQSLSWCDPQLCPHGIQHIACGNTGVSRKYCLNLLKINYKIAMKP